MTWLRDLLRTGVGVASEVVTTGGLTVQVAHAPYLGRDPQGRKQYGAPVVRTALFEDRDEETRSDTGAVVDRRRVLTFFEDLALSYDDRLMVNGAVAPIARIDRGVVPDDHDAFVVQVWLGQG